MGGGNVLLAAVEAEGQATRGLFASLVGVEPSFVAIVPSLQLSTQ
ncbi:MAG TPA: hypothetical protein VNO34_01990 [Actinomycetota bacterium]|nr:hypothetical protein [Actinomycetota bacterium]